jgi:hypothetical protein
MINENDYLSENHPEKSGIDERINHQAEENENLNA